MTINDFLFIHRAGGSDMIAMGILGFMLQNSNLKTHIFMGSYDIIAKGTNLSTKTVADTMPLLIEAGFVKKIKNSQWLMSSEFYHDIDEPETEETGPAVWFQARM